MTHQITNPFLEFHKQVDKNPRRFGNDIKNLIKIQKEMLKIYDFHEDKGKGCCDWIEKFCVLTQGEKAGQNVRLLLWQKWFIYSIFCFWGYFEEPTIDELGQETGVITRKYLRVVNDVLLLISSGNSKTTIMSWINGYLLYSKHFTAANVYIGSNSREQSLLCFEATCTIIEKNKNLNKFAQIKRSDNKAIVTCKDKIPSAIYAMSSDGKNYEGIIPTMIMIDEIHEFTQKRSKYARDLRKSVKRDDSLIVETTTEGTVREGYLDDRTEYSRKVLSGQVKDYRFLPVLFTQDSIEEVFEAYETKETQIFMKSNPSLGYGVSSTALIGKVQKMIDDESQRSAILTKNFNLPQNPNSVYLTKEECITPRFDESIFKNQPIYIGIDHAFTRSPNSDFSNIKIAVVNPLTDERFIKSIFFMPSHFKMKDEELIDAVKAKSKEDGVEYQKYVDFGDIVIIDGYEISEEMLLRYILDFVKTNHCTIKKIGLDPTNLKGLESYFAQATGNSKFCIPVFSQKKMWNTPRILSIKRYRADKKVFCNNRLDIIQNANTICKKDSNDYIFLDTLENRKHNDAIYAELGLETAIETFMNATDPVLEQRNIDLMKRGFIEAKMNYEKFKEGDSDGNINKNKECD